MASASPLGFEPSPAAGLSLIGVAYRVRNRQGEVFEDAEESIIDPVLAELDTPIDEEHPDVAFSHETEWTLSAFPSGLLVWENV